MMGMIMKRNDRNRLTVFLNVLMVFLLLLSGCSKSTSGPMPPSTGVEQTEEQTAKQTAESTSAVPAETAQSAAEDTDGADLFAEVDEGGNMQEPTDTGADMNGSDLSLTGLRFTAWGMMMQPSYSIREVPEGFECAITGDEIYWPAMDGDDLEEDYEINEERGYAWDSFSGPDPLGPDAGTHSAVTVGDSEMQELFDKLMAENILEWDGYDEIWEAPEGMEVTDTGETFNLDLLFSDGKHLKAHGIDTFPENYGAVVKVIYDFFEEHQDYSQYYPTDFPEEAPTTLIVKFYDPHHFGKVPNYQIELHKSWGNEWIIRFTDPEGEFMTKGSDISKYGYVKDGVLPLEQFQDILKKYDLGSWNQREDHESGGPDEYWEITAYYENGQTYYVSTNYRPDNYDDFRNEMITAIRDYYNEVAETAEN